MFPFTAEFVNRLRENIEHPKFKMMFLRNSTGTPVFRMKSHVKDPNILIEEVLKGVMEIPDVHQVVFFFKYHLKPVTLVIADYLLPSDASLVNDVVHAEDGAALEIAAEADALSQAAGPSGAVSPFDELRLKIGICDNGQISNKNVITSKWSLVSTLKKLILPEVSPSKSWLTIEGLELKDSQRLCCYELEQNSTLLLVVKPEDSEHDDDETQMITMMARVLMTKLLLAV